MTTIRCEYCKKEHKCQTIRTRDRFEQDEYMELPAGWLSTQRHEEVYYYCSREHVRKTLRNAAARRRYWENKPRRFADVKIENTQLLMKKYADSIKAALEQELPRPGFL